MLSVALAILWAVTAAVRIQAGRWLRPSAMLAAYWAISATVPVVLFSATYVTARAILYIAVVVVVFGLGAAVSGRRTTCGPEEHRKRETYIPSTQLLLLVVKVATLCGIAAGLLALRAYGLSASILLTDGGVLESGNSIAVSRYSGRAAGSPIVAALLGVTYCGAILAPFLRGAALPVWRGWLLGPLCGALFYSTITTERLGFLIAAANTIGGYVAARILLDRDAPRVTRRGVLATAGTICGLACAFVSIAFVRVGSFDSRYVPIVRGKLAIYAFGYEPAFSRWLERRALGAYDGRPPGLGTATIAGTSLLTGQSRTDTRAYNEFTIVNNDGSSTNIYTAFRGLLIDFGEPGAIAIVFLFGFATGRAYRRVVEFGSPAAAGWLACIYAVILTSNIMSIWSFTNVAFGHLAAVGLLLYSGSRNGGSTHHEILIMNNSKQLALAPRGSDR